MATKKDLQYYLGLNWSYTIEQEVHKKKKYTLSELMNFLVYAPMQIR